MIRKTLLLAVVLTVLTGGLAFAQISVGLESGAGFFLNDVGGIDDGDINRFSLPVMATAHYRLPSSVEVPGMGEAFIDVGLNAGFLRIFSASGEYDFGAFGSFEYDYVLNTVPIMLTGEARVDNWFTKLGLGVHAWTLNFDINGDDYGDNGIDFASTLAAGYVLDLSDQLAMKLGAQFFSVGFEGEDEENDAIIVNVLAGVQYSF